MIKFKNKIEKELGVQVGILDDIRLSVILRDKSISCNFNLNDLFETEKNVGSNPIEIIFIKMAEQLDRSVVGVSDISKNKYQLRIRCNNEERDFDFFDFYNDVKS